MLFIYFLNILSQFAVNMVTKFDILSHIFLKLSSAAISLVCFSSINSNCLLLIALCESRRHLTAASPSTNTLFLFCPLLRMDGVLAGVLQEAADMEVEGREVLEVEGAADVIVEGTDDVEGDGTADTEGEGTADVKGEGIADVEGEGRPDAKGEGTEDMEGKAAVMLQLGLLL